LTQCELYKLHETVGPDAADGKIYAIYNANKSIDSMLVEEVPMKGFPSNIAFHPFGFYL
jgi:hypothetical protein